MPESKARKQDHHQHHVEPKHARPVNSSRAAIAATVLFAFFGITIGYFIGGTLTSAIIGAAAGGISGFLLGHLMDRSLKKK